MSHAEFAYALARLRACHGRLPGVAAWQALEASRTAAHYLALARAGPLAEWVQALNDATDAHAVERGLRKRWQQRVERVAAWLPARWQAPLRWFGTLPELPLSGADAHDTTQRWLAQWQGLLPPDAALPALRRPAELLLPRLHAPGAERGAADEKTRRALHALFRRPATPALAALAHLALVALDLERLRGGLVARLLFEPAPLAEKP